MKMTTKSTLTLSLAILMTACASNKGDVALTAIEPIKPPSTNTPIHEDVPTPPRTAEELDALMEPSLGFHMATVRRNLHADSTEEHVPLSADMIKPINDRLSRVVDRHKKDLNNLNGASSLYSDNYEDSHSPVPTSAGAWYGSRDRDYMKFVKSGWVADLQPRPNFATNTIHNGMNGFVFYQGTNPATALPTQTITYKGTWDFMTDAKKGRSSDEFHSEYKKNAGADYSAFSFHESTKDDAKWRDEGRTGDVSHTRVFTVDFANKTLTGELSRHKSKSEKVKRYDIKADIKDNRFRGSATASNPNDPFFKSNSKSLEGGFFGEHAEELAGKFLADDNSLFAVFGARQHKDGKWDDIDPTEKAFDAVKFGIDELDKSSLDTFGDATKLVINGRSFSLLPATGTADFIQTNKYDVNGKNLVISACCGNLNHVKFGTYFYDDNGSKSDAYLFLTGERTALSEMPKAGELEYHGTWQAYILTKDSLTGAIDAGKGQNASRAEFGVNFDNKTLKGTLYAGGSVAPSIIIDNGVISGNGFTADFRTGEKGLSLDKSSMSGAVAHLSGKVDGGFYGKNATELGGSFYSERTSKKDGVAGVFGAKQQVKK
ncbi:transferrin-binding protein-like solute binding protein [Moraxella sp. K1630]|uniref:transferrin-binding protein-like solute binding protein n=1 Tax=Moraxella sp. K1630 TaxID=2780078 RepID=UPI00187EE8C6|nr:transferrin-binding protein-like solute binding protein [Moraxella sp. K1630]MBE9587993.1 transferrin-binding protein-like solute binding protein [Moraxella sp. K1630]